jgi:hypothetical protein
MLPLIRRYSVPVKQVLHDNLDLVVSIVVVLPLSLLSRFTDYISMVYISPRLSAAIFTVVVGSTGTLFSILIVYSRIIRMASDSNYLKKMKRTFKWPFHTAILGFVIAILASMFRIQDPALTEWRFIFTLEGWLSTLMALLLVYSILAFRGAFFFVTEATISVAESEDEESS